MPLTQVSSRAIEDTLRYVLGASGTSHYTFTGKGLNGAVNDPTIYLVRGQTYIFENRSGGHPFYIKTSIANGGTNDAYNTGVTNNGGGNGTEIVFTVPHDAPDTLYYQCSSHASMAGEFKIAGSVADGSITESKLADDAVTADKLANSINSAIAANTAKDLTALSASNLTSGTIPDARFPATLPAISGANLTNLVSGLTEVDSWRISSSLSNYGDNYITSNWERNDTYFDKIGTGLTESSGVFSFPSTGIYLLIFNGQATGNGDTYIGIKSYLSTNNGSSYNSINENYGSAYSGGGGTYASFTLIDIIDVTDTSNYKWRYMASSSGTVNYHGLTSQSRNGFICLKLGET